MDPLKTDAIVLRVVEFSESSCIVTLFTKELGKISTIAKGARRKKSPFEAALDLIAICRIVFLHKSSQSLDILTEAKLHRRFRSSAKDLQRFYAGLYVIELLNLMTDEADPHEALFDQAVTAIETIDSIDDQTFAQERPSKTLSHRPTQDRSWEHAVMHFEIHLLDLLGHLPMLTHCVDCGRKKTTVNRVEFGLNRGGIICQNCRPGKSSIISLSSEGLELMLKLTGEEIPRQQTDGDDQEVEVIDLCDQPGYGEVQQLIRMYITHLIGHPPKLYKYLGVPLG